MTMFVYKLGAVNYATLANNLISLLELKTVIVSVITLRAFPLLVQFFLKRLVLSHSNKVNMRNMVLTSKLSNSKKAI